MKVKVCKKCKASFVPKYNENWCNICMIETKEKEREHIEKEGDPRLIRRILDKRKKREKCHINNV